MAKWFCGCGFARLESAVRRFFCAHIATVGSVIAVRRAAALRGGGNIVRPTAGTRTVWKGDSIIGTGSALTGSGAVGLA